MPDYNEQRYREYQRLQAIAHALADSLGKPWGVHHEPRHPDDRSVPRRAVVAMGPVDRQERGFAPAVTLCIEDGRAAAHGTWPRTLTGDLIYPYNNQIRTTHSLERDPVAAAKDVRRRFCDPYFKEHAARVEICRKHDYREVQRRGAEKVIAQALRSQNYKPLVDGVESSRRDIHIHSASGLPSVSARVIADDSVELKTTGLTREQAFDMIRAVIPRARPACRLQWRLRYFVRSVRFRTA